MAVNGDRPVVRPRYVDGAVLPRLRGAQGEDPLEIIEVCQRGQLRPLVDVALPRLRLRIEPVGDADDLGAGCQGVRGLG